MRLMTSVIQLYRTKRHSKSQFTGKNAADNELVQLAGITSSMCTGRVFLNPYMKGFLLISFLVDMRYRVCGLNRSEPNRSLSLFKVCQR